MRIRVTLFACALLSASVARADAWLGPDKALHYGISTGLAGGGYAASVPLFEQRSLRLGFGFGVALAAGAGKELYDLSGRGDPSWRDFTWDALGAATGALLAFVIDVLVSPPRAREPEAVCATRRIPGFNLARWRGGAMSQ